MHRGTATIANHGIMQPLGLERLAGHGTESSTLTYAGVVTAGLYQVPFAAWTAWGFS